ncbi:hypothetical protein [Marinomonas sp. TW1]|uniref:hypothetical protein n=1 Tax=Marinomonas sp. TW1 TaxID=1561203 RepID=UPI0012E76ED9|nr:hypothetical protein [Marinomonas sp. TW1]
MDAGVVWGDEAFDFFVAEAGAGADAGTDELGVVVFVLLGQFAVLAHGEGLAMHAGDGFVFVAFGWPNECVGWWLEHRVSLFCVGGCHLVV